MPPAGVTSRIKPPAVPPTCNRGYGVWPLGSQYLSEPSQKAFQWGGLFLKRPPGASKGPQEGPQFFGYTADEGKHRQPTEVRIPQVFCGFQGFWRMLVDRKMVPRGGIEHRHCDFQSHALPTELPGRTPNDVRTPLIDKNRQACHQGFLLISSRGLQPEKATPCGSRALIIQAPPGTSCGPLITLPPAFSSLAWVASISSTQK